MTLTKEEYLSRSTSRRTEATAFRCMNCGSLEEIPTAFPDGNACSVCGEHILAPLSHLEPAKPRKRPTQYEAAEQKALFEWAGYMSNVHPELELLHHIPNGGHRNKAEAAHLKQQGVKAGVPDLHLPVARGGCHGLYIELKAHGNKPTQNQKEWLRLLSEQNYKTAVCHGWEEAAEVILAYLTA